MSDGKPSDLVRSVVRAAQILEELGSRRDGLTAKRIATRCRLNLATTYHLLRTLRYEQYVVQGPGHRYFLGPRVASQFRDLKAALEQPPHIGEVLRHISETTGQSAYYGQFIGEHLLVSDVVEGPYSPHLEQLMVHFDEAPHATAIGKALLWALPSTTRREYLKQRGLRPFTSNTVVHLDTLDHELKSLAHRHVFVEHEQYRSNVCCAAVLVRHHDHIIGAIGIPAPAERWRRSNTDLIRALRTAVADLRQPV